MGGEFWNESVSIGRLEMTRYIQEQGREEESAKPRPT
jgi:hypothetical protein